MKEGRQIYSLDYAEKDINNESTFKFNNDVNREMRKFLLLYLLISKIEKKNLIETIDYYHKTMETQYLYNKWNKDKIIPKSKFLLDKRNENYITWIKRYHLE